MNAAYPPDGVLATAPSAMPKLLDQVRSALRTKYLLSYRTEQVYKHSIRRFIVRRCAASPSRAMLSAGSRPPLHSATAFAVEIPSATRSSVICSTSREISTATPRRHAATPDHAVASKRHNPPGRAAAQECSDGRKPAVSFLANNYQLRADSFPLIPRRRLRSCRRARLRRRGDGRRYGAHRSRCTLQLSDPSRHLRLKSVLTERPLIIGQRLHVIARLIAQPAERRQRPGIVWVDGECIHELRFRLLSLTRFFQQAGQLNLRLRRLRTVARPMVEQVECFLLTVRFRQQHGQTAITLGMVRVAFQALVIQVLGLLEIVRPVVQRTRFVERRRQVVIAFRRFWVLSDGLLEPVRRLLVIALLIQPNSLDIRRLRLDVAATTRRRQTNHDSQRHPSECVCLWLAGFRGVRRHGHNSQRGLALRKGRRRFIRRRIGGGEYQSPSHPARRLPIGAVIRADHMGNRPAAGKKWRS